MLVEIDACLIETSGGVTVLAAVQTRIVHADVAADDASARIAFGRVFRTWNVHAGECLGDHLIVYASSRTDSERPQVDLLGTANDVHPVRPGKFSQVTH